MKKSNRRLLLALPATFLYGICWLISGFLSLHTQAQFNPERGLPFITNYKTKEYNASPQNWCIMEASNGLMYFGNSFCILEYDGVKWRRISNLIARAMAKDKSGRIYYGAYSDFGYLAPDSLGLVKPQSLLPHVPASLRHFNDVWSVHAGDDGIYFQARERIFRLRPKGGNKWEVKAWTPQTKFMYAFYLDGTYYVHEQGVGLLKLQGDALKLIPGSEFLGNERTQVMLPYPAPKGEKHYLLGQFYSGLFLFDGKSFRRFPTEADPYIIRNTLYKAVALKDGTYALTTTGAGLVIIDAQGKLRQRINRDVGLQDESVYGVYSDSKGVLWLGLDNGISRVETGSPFTQFAIESDITSSALSVVRFEGKLYLGTANGVLVFNKATARFDPLEEISANQIFSMMADKETLLVPSDGFYGISGGKVRQIHPSRSGDLQMQTLLISRKHPHIMFATLSGGFALFTRRPGMKDWQLAGRVPGISDDGWTMAEDKDGIVWLGTQSNGALRLKFYLDGAGNPVPEKTKVDRFDTTHGLSPGGVSVMQAGGVIYFGTNRALYHFDPGNNRFVRDNTFGDLHFGDDVNEYAMTTDARGRVWITMEKGITLATPKPGGGYTLEKVPFLPIADRSIAWIYPEADGTTWFCTPEGLVRFDERLAKNYDQPYKTVLRQVLAGKEHLSTINGAGAGKEPSLSFARNTLRFDFAAPFFEQEDKTEYQTWLEGFDPGWSDWDNNHYKEYTNLSNGDYRFHVRAKNIYGKLSEAAVFGFQVLPPWYRTWWAYAFYALLGVGIIYAIVRYRTHQLHEKHRELEKTVAERTTELSQRVAELQVINVVQEGLVREMDIDAIYELVGNKIRDVFDAQSIGIATFDHEAGTEHFKYVYEKGVRYYPEPRPLDNLRRHLIQTRQKIVVNEHAAEVWASLGVETLPNTEETKSAVFVPLVLGDRITSYITLQNIDREHAFSTSDVRLLETLANSMSVALENARLFDEINRLLRETEQRNAELAVINVVQEGLVREMDITAIYDLMGNKIRDVFDAQTVVIATFDHEAGTEHFKYLHEKGVRYYPEPRPLDKLRQHMIQTRQKVLINERAAEAMERFDMHVVPNTEFAKSLLFVPLVLGDKINSYVSLQNVDRENAFSSSDVRLLETLANSMSVALENARLFDQSNRLLRETEQRNAELAVINSVQESLVAQMDMQAIYELVGEKIRQIFNAQVVDIVTYNRTTGLIEDRYSYEKGDRSMVAPRPPGGFRKHVLETGQSLCFNENMEQMAKEYDNPIISGEFAKSVVFVPMTAGGKTTGVISLQNVDQEGAFTESDVKLLTTLSNSMSVALESARLFDETKHLLKVTEQRNAELAVINSVQESLVAQMDMQAIYDLVGEKIREIFDAQVIDIVTYDKTKNLIEDRYAYEKGDRTLIGPREPNGFRRHVIETRQVLLHNENIEQIAREFGNQILFGEMPKSQVYVPMMAAGEVTGIISLQNLDREHAISESDVSLLTTLANSMSVALESARLFDETKRLLKETEQRNAELAIINGVQEGLVREMDIQGIYDFVGEKIREIFNAQVIDIVTYDRNRNLIEDRYAYERGDRTLVGRREPKGFRKHVLDTGQQLLFNRDIPLHRAEYDNTIMIGEGAKSVLFVPMIAGGKTTGVISLQNMVEEDAFSESDAKLLTTLANSMSVALESARLFDETKRLLAETEKGKKNIELLSEIGKEITASLDFETIFYKLYEHINQLADATVFGIGLYDAEQQIIDYKFAVEKGKRYEPYTRDTRNKDQFPVWCIENRQPVFINNVREEYSRYISSFDDTVAVLEDGTVSEDPVSLIYLPLMVQDRVLGIITIQSFEKNAYSEYHLNLLQNLATYTSIALDNANAYRQLNVREQEIGRRAAELATVNNISQALASQLNLKELIDLVGDQMRQLFKANIVYLAMLDKKTRIITFPYQYGDDLPPLKLGEGLTSRILLSGEPLLLNREVQTKTEEMGIEHIGIPAASYLGVPIPVGDEVIGVLSVQSTVEENRFDVRDQSLLSSIAASVGVAIRKAKLFEEVKQARQEAEAARKTAEQANEAKSAFLSTVSHELRTPLTSVLGFAKIIKKRLEDKVFPSTDQTDAKTGKTIQQVSENLSVVIAEGERLTHLINDVLDLAKIEAGKMEWNMGTVSITEVIERAIAATTALFYQKNIPLEREFELDLPEITGDRDKLIQVVVNLLSNAVKFTERGSVTCRAFVRDGEVVVSVADTGIGIAPQDHAAVFEQFKQVGDTLTDKPKGTGLGLPISKEIIEHHGGRIWLESEMGKGSTFSFALPVSKTGAAKPLQFDDLVRRLKEQMAQSHLNLKGRNATILIVDDEEAIRSLLRQELTEAGYLIDEASNGREALERVRANKPDLIILDIMMPEINGFDVAAILKNDPQTMDIPIIVLSIVQDKARGYRIGVDRYLTKPIDTTLLFSEVDHLLEQGKSKKKVMVVDEDSVTISTLTEVLQAKGYQVVESDGKELVEKAIATQPDIIILNSVLNAKDEAVQALRFEKGLENVLFLIYQSAPVENPKLKSEGA